MKKAPNILHDVPTSKRGKVCWCGEERLQPFSPTYQLCPNCSTLVLRKWPDDSTFIVENDSTDFYGKDYFTTHVSELYGQISLDERARRDLSERCLHWLKTLRKYKMPPAKVLELGTGHGGFVALCSWARFDALGLEMSPWVVEYAKRTFNIPMLTGPIEVQKIPKESLDVIALMDVLEHLPTPASTMSLCLTLLKKDGILLIQTPGYREGVTYEQIVSSGDRFIEQFKATEHLYLFSQKAARLFFERLGAREVVFESAYYDFYDMYFVVGKSNLTLPSEVEVSASITATPPGKLIHALLDIDGRLKSLGVQLQVAEADREARRQVIEDQGKLFGEIEAERNRLRSLLQEKEMQLSLSEEDRAVRLKHIQEQSKVSGEIEAERNRLRSLLQEKEMQLSLSEEDRAARLKHIQEQSKVSGEIEAERNRLRSLLQEKEMQLNLSEEDRSNRLRIIEEQGRRLGEVEGVKNNILAQLSEVQNQFKTSEEDRAARMDVIRDQAVKMTSLEYELNQTSIALREIRIEHADQSLIVRGLNEQIQILRNQLNVVQSVLEITRSSLPMRLLGVFGINQKIAKSIESGFENGVITDRSGPRNRDDGKP